MKRIPARRYAAQKRMSLFEVSKMAQSGALPSEEIEENGTRTLYILVHDSPPKPDASEERPSPAPPKERSDLYRRIETLERRVEHLEALIKGRDKKG